ncbi:MAG: hypothetical protein ACYSUI_18285 [Planctomycetota bacterium]|jgi:hypothetical protein
MSVLQSVSRIVSLGLVATWPVHEALAGTGGRSSPVTRYVGKTLVDKDSRKVCELSVDIDRFLFMLNTVESKYRVIRIEVSNWRPKSIRLSRADDSITAVLEDGRKIAGILNLPEKDPKFWASISLGQREKLLYTSPIEPAQMRDEEHDPSPGRRQLFAFFPSEPLDELPVKFYWKIESLEKGIVIAPRPATGD